MEQYYKHSVALDPKFDKGKEPVIAVHCKAGKGRTGMMICSLLLFLGMFPSSSTAIAHYNKARARNEKAITISSQKRYVKFFEGFLNYKLFENAAYDELQRDYLNYFEKSLRQYNKLQMNSVFDDMRSEHLELYSVAMGPFKEKPKDMDF
jgi:ABC-type molybdate transport system ATPase subunit